MRGTHLEKMGWDIVGRLDFGVFSLSAFILLRPLPLMGADCTKLLEQPMIGE